jgi:hypothetical protein
LREHVWRLAGNTFRQFAHAGTRLRIGVTFARFWQEPFALDRP